MKVETIITKEGKKRYLLLDSNGEVVLPVAKFLKFKDNANNARNTLRRYCYDLKLYFEFLEQKEITYEEVGIDLIAEFMGWLKNPYKNTKMIHLNTSTSDNVDKLKVRKNKTVNDIINSVLNFYDYIDKHEELGINISDKFRKQIAGNKVIFKDFLHHISHHKKVFIKTLKLKEPKKRLKILTEEQVETLINSCTNIRDKFLLFLLYETGMRIGEALSLHLSDIQLGVRKIHIRDKGELENDAEIKTVGSERTIDCSQELLNLYSTYILEVHTDEVDTDFVFIKLSGEDKHSPMTYTTVEGLFKSLQRKIDFKVNPHMFRHTSLNSLRKRGMKPEVLKQRAGHKHLQTTLDMYCHITEEEVREEWESTRGKIEGTGENL